MSHRHDAPWIAGAHVHGVGGLGVLGSEIPSTGTSGPAYAYNDLALPADAGKEIRGLITAWPSAGTLTAYEDTSFTFDGPDGSYTAQYQLYVDGVAIGGPATIALKVGIVVTVVAPTTGDIALTGYAPTIARTAHQAVLPATGALSITGFAPTVARTANQAIAPAVGALSIAGFAPTVTRSAKQSIYPAVGTLAVTGYAPAVEQSSAAAIKPATGTLTLTGQAPVVTQSQHQRLAPSAGTLNITGYAPAVAQSDQRIIASGVGVIDLTGFAPVVSQSDWSVIGPGSGLIVICGYAPSVERSGAVLHAALSPDRRGRFISRRRPAVISTARRTPR